MNTDIGLALSGAGTLTLAVVFFYFPWQSLVVDQTRQRLFEIRDKWFDYSQGLESDADKVAAAEIRAELNYMIRMLHHFTVPVFIYAYFVSGFFYSAKDGKDELSRAIDKLQTKEARKKASTFVYDAIGSIIWCMARRSLLALCTLPLVALVVTLVSATIGSANAISGSLEKWVATLAIKDNSQLVPGC